MSKGIKYDEGKSQLRLLPFLALQSIGKVLTYGANKYEPNNWRDYDLEPRIQDALFRHLFAYFSGEKNDQESQLSHLAHAACNILYLLEFEESKKTGGHPNAYI